MKLNQEILAKKYAQAFLKVTDNRFSLAVVDVLDQIVDFFDKHRETFFYTKLSCIQDSLKQAMFFQICERFGQGDLLQPLIRLLAQHNRLFIFADVLEQVAILYKDIQGVVDVRIMSSHVISEEEQKIIEKFLERITQKKVRSVVVVDHALIAGIRVQSDTFLLEHSVAQQLRNIQSSFIVSG